MKLKVLFVLTILAIVGVIVAHGDTVWTNYPFAQYPAIVTGDWTFLLGSQAAHGNRQLSMTTMMLITKTNAQAGMQPESANLDAWSLLSPSTKQDHSVNLDLWNAVTPSQYQTHSSGLDLWSGVTSIDAATLQISSGVLSVIGGASSGQPPSANLTNWSAIATSTKQDHSANLDSWSALSTSAKQDALGFTPLTFVQTSNLILTLTLPIDSIAFPGVVTLFGVDSSTNPVPIHFRNNLSFTSDGIGGYYADASSGGGGGASALVNTNIYVRNTNGLIIDPQKAQTYSFGVLTNSILLFSNTPLMTNLTCHDLQINLHNWTNGGSSILAIKNLAGNLTTNGLWVYTTNGNASDILFARVDGTYTNIILSALTNVSSYVDTNSLLVPSGGGGGSWTLLAHAEKEYGTGTRTTSAINCVGAALIIVSFWGNDTITGPTVTDNASQSYTLTSSCNSDHSRTGYIINPSASSAMTFSVTAGAGCAITVQAWSHTGGSPAFDSAGTCATTGNWNTTPPVPGACTPTGANDLMFTSCFWDTVTGVGVAVDSGYTIAGQANNTATLGGASAYKIKSSDSTAETPIWTEVQGSNPDAYVQTMCFK